MNLFLLWHCLFFQNLFFLKSFNLLNRINFQMAIRFKEERERELGRGDKKERVLVQYAVFKPCMLLFKLFLYF